MGVFIVDEKTYALLKELSEKLGTTGEHLWGVLVRQAQISGIAELLVIVAWWSISFLGLKFIIKKTTRIKDTDGYSIAEWEGEGAFFAWCGWSMYTAIILVLSGVEVVTIAGALLNPEYWALKQLLS
jgi:hypothetical protein